MPEVFIDGRSYPHWLAAAVDRLMAHHGYERHASSDWCCAVAALLSSPSEGHLADPFPSDRFARLSPPEVRSAERAAEDISLVLKKTVEDVAYRDLTQRRAAVGSLIAEYDAELDEYSRCLTLYGDEGDPSDAGGQRRALVSALDRLACLDRCLRWLGDEAHSEVVSSLAQRDEIRGLLHEPESSTDASPPTEVVRQLLMAVALGDEAGAETLLHAQVRYESADPSVGAIEGAGGVAEFLCSAGECPSLLDFGDTVVVAELARPRRARKFSVDAGLIVRVVETHV